MRASLADQSLAIALGANLPSPAGDPIDTLVAVRPQLEGLVTAWWAGLERDGGDDAVSGPGGESPHPHWSWSPLFATAPVGGPVDQPTYCNAVLVVEGGPGLVAPCAQAAQELMQGLQQFQGGLRTRGNRARTTLHHQHGIAIVGLIRRPTHRCGGKQRRP